MGLQKEIHVGKLPGQSFEIVATSRHGTRVTLEKKIPVRGISIGYGRGDIDNMPSRIYSSPSTAENVILATIGISV